MSISDNLNTIKFRIAEAEAESQRPSGSVKLLAVSKGQEISAILEAFQLGQRDFGESYLQEALPKMEALHQYPLIWHFIGPIQGNKTRMIAEHFDWIHSISRENIAQKLDHHRPDSLPPLQVCIQVNISGEKSKSGVAPEESFRLATRILQYPRLQLRGLMLIPPKMENEETQYQWFLSLQQLLNRINDRLGIQMDTLSMGMTDDFIPAIRAGSTCVRIGRSFFGYNNR